MRIQTWIKEAQDIFNKMPRGYWLYIANGEICVMKYDLKGKRIMDGYYFNDAAIVGRINMRDGTDIDGGDW